MTLLLFLKPITHQGFSPPADDDGLKKKKKKRAKKPTKVFTENLAQTLEVKVVDVTNYIDDVLKREAQIARLRQLAEEARAAAEKLRAEKQAEALRLKAEEERIQAEAEAQRLTEELIEQIGAMVKRAIDAKRKRLNKLIAYILDWL